MIKQTNALRCSLDKETEQLLNQQIAMESDSSSQYLAMASWSDQQGYRGAAHFLYHHAEEERKHMLKIFHYINDMGGYALSPEVKAVKTNFASLHAIFQSILSHEMQVTQSIHRLVTHCLATKNFSTFHFLYWFLAEQSEEEILARRALELFDLIGQEGVGLYTIDKEIGVLAGEVEKSE